MRRSKKHWKAPFLDGPLHCLVTISLCCLLFCSIMLHGCSFGVLLVLLHHSVALLLYHHIVGCAPLHWWCCVVMLLVLSCCAIGITLSKLTNLIFGSWKLNMKIDYYHIFENHSVWKLLWFLKTYCDTLIDSHKLIFLNVGNWNQRFSSQKKKNCQH